MISFKHLKISLFAYWPTRKLAYFRYNYPAPLSTKKPSPPATLQKPVFQIAWCHLRLYKY